MKKRILGLISAGILSATMIACGTTEPQTENKTENNAESSNIGTSEVSEGSETAENAGSVETTESGEISEANSDSWEAKDFEEMDGAEIVTIDGYQTKIVMFYNEKDEDAYLNGQEAAFDYAVKHIAEMGYDDSQVKKMSYEQLKTSWSDGSITTDNFSEFYPREDYLYMTKDWQVIMGIACQYGYEYTDENGDLKRMIVAYDNVTGLAFESTQRFVDATMHSFLFSPYSKPAPAYYPTFGYPDYFDGFCGCMEDGCEIENMLDFLAVVHKDSNPDRYFISFDYPGLDELSGIIDVEKIYEVIEVIEKYAVSNEEIEYDGVDRISREFYLK